MISSLASWQTSSGLFSLTLGPLCFAKVLIISLGLTSVAGFCHRKWNTIMVLSKFNKKKKKIVLLNFIVGLSLTLFSWLLCHSMTVSLFLSTSFSYQSALNKWNVTWDFRGTYLPFIYLRRQFRQCLPPLPSETHLHNHDHCTLPSSKISGSPKSGIFRRRFSFWIFIKLRIHRLYSIFEHHISTRWWIWMKYSYCENFSW